MPAISVIMPSYNVKNYIRECLESVCRQTFGDLEILVIDAGSDDGTLDVLHEFEQADSRVKVCLSDEKSYGYQVNKGIALAQGEYIAIVETDDIVEDNMLELLYREAKKYDLDYAKGQFAKLVAFNDGTVWTQRMRMYPLDKALENIVITPSKDIMCYVRDIYLWSGIYKKEFLIQNNIKINETKGAAYQDVGFAFQVIGCAKKALYIPDVVYNYRQNNENSSIFNKNGFRYLAGEYPFVEDICKQKQIVNDVFEEAYYTRMYLQTMTRYTTMAASGEVWKDTLSEREFLREKIIEADKLEKFETLMFDKRHWEDFQMYLESEEDFLQYFLSVYQAKRKCLKAFLEKAKSAKKIVFYSKSMVGGFVYCLLKTAGLDTPVLFCDNDETKQGSSYMNASVLSVSDAVLENPDALYVLANRNVNLEMKQQLLDLGIEKKQIYTWRMDTDILLLHMIKK